MMGEMIISNNIENMGSSGNFGREQEPPSKLTDQAIASLEDDLNPAVTYLEFNRPGEMKPEKDYL